MQASRHLLTRATHCLRLSARLGVASRLTAASLPASQNMWRRGVITGQGVGQQVDTTGKEQDLPLRDASVAMAVPNPDTSMLKVNWVEGGTDLFPYVWLRDNCQCSSCFHTVSKGRMLMVEDLRLDVNPTSVQVAGSGGEVEVQWSDGHVSSYRAKWLHERAFTKASEEAWENSRRLRKSLWGSEILDNLPTASFPELLEDDMALLTFLQQLEVMGLVVVSGTPCRVGQLHRLSDRVGHLVKTHYGETFCVQSKVDPNNLAYTSKALCLHGDQPYLSCTPEIQLLHCITQFHGEGGENLLVDSHHVAHMLRSLHPDKFHILTSVLVNFADVGFEDGKEFSLLHKAPIIRLDYDGDIQKVNFNRMQRDSFFLISPDKVASWYDAKLTFYNILTDPQNCIKYKLKEGDIVVFDNSRVLHGRTGYEIAHGERHLEGGYWNWDQVRSRRRVLQNTH